MSFFILGLKKSLPVYHNHVWDLSCADFKLHSILYLVIVNSKITKYSEKNSKGKVPNQIAKSKAQTHQTNEYQLSYFWLGTGIF